MVIVVNAKLLRKDKLDGIGWFIYNTLKRIVVKNPDITFHFLFDSEIDPSYIFSSNVIPHKLFPPAKHAILNLVWFESSVKRMLKRIQPDLFLSFDGILSLTWSGKQFGVIHDVNFVYLPKAWKLSSRKYFNYFFKKYAHRAVRLATVSEYSKMDIGKTYNIPLNNIDVVYNGINDFFRPLTLAEQITVREKISNGMPYFLFVGTISPRKNIANLMLAFDKLKREQKCEHKLIVAGWFMYKKAEIMKLRSTLEFGSDIIFTGRMSNEELTDAMGAATSLVYVSLFEGFGIPIIEAMQADVPVITTNATSMPEVAGDAAILVDATNVDDIKNAMYEVATNEDLRADLIAKGRAQRTRFSWDKTADLLWSSISKCLSL